MHYLLVRIINNIEATDTKRETIGVISLIDSSNNFLTGSMYIMSFGYTTMLADFKP
jgi:hypothetical protein